MTIKTKTKCSNWPTKEKKEEHIYKFNSLSSPLYIYMCIYIYLNSEKVRKHTLDLISHNVTNASADPTAK